MPIPPRRPDRAMRAMTLLLSATIAAASASAMADDAPVATADAATAERSARAREYFGDARLLDQDGRPHRFYSDLLDGRVVLINVVFTHCQSACPMMTERLKLVRRQLGPAFGREVNFLSLSIDPARDTPDALKRFAQRHGVDEPGWRFLVAEPAVLKALLGRLGQWTDDPENHTTLLIAGNAAKAHWIKLRPDAPPERLAADIERLK